MTRAIYSQSSVTVGLNGAAVRIGRALGEAGDSLNGSLARLSSGKRINKGSDDAAALAVAESLRLTTRIASVALRNANDGISIVSIADNALSQISNILQRQSELATQAANGSFTLSQRSVISAEFEKLGSEVERIATTTAFNGVALLSGTSSIVLQVGMDTASVSQLTVQNAAGTLQAIGLAANGSSALTYSLSGDTTDFSQSAARAALQAITNALDSVSSKRGSLGVLETRLNSQINVLSSAKENAVAAEARIRDLDVAEEAANVTRQSILQQVGASVYAQANQAPRIALSLLQ
jgi:flagellin